MRLRRTLSPAAARRLFALSWLVVALTSVASGWFFFGRAPAADRRPYIEGVLGQPERVSPLFAQPGTPDADLVALVFAGLTRPRGDGTPIPDLAESWDVTPDGLRYTFRLRSALFWHDGTPVTAADVAFTVAKVQEAGFRGLPALASDWAGVAATAIDERTVAFVLRASTATFLTRAALPILPRHLLADVAPADMPDADFNQHPVGSGPYRLTSLTRTRANLEANANYHLGAPALHAVELHFFRDESTLATAIENRELDAALLPSPLEGSAARAAAARTDLTRTDLPEASYTVLYLNNQRPPLDETRTRLAIAAAIDRAALLREVFGGRGRAGSSPLVAGSWAAPEDAPTPIPAGPTSEALFADAGWLRGPGGVRTRGAERLKLTLETNAEPTRLRLAEAVAAQLRAAGVDVEVATLPGVQFVQQRLQPRNYQLAIFGWDTGPDPDPYGAWHTSQIVGSGRNFAGYHDATMDALLERARATLDQVERTELYRQFEVRFLQEAPSVVLHYPARAYVHPRVLTGLDTGPQFEPSSRFRGIERWRLLDGAAR